MGKKHLNTNDMDMLQLLRKKIDTVDDAILDLLQQRAAISFEVGQTKKNTSIYHPERELAVVTRLKQRNDAPLVPVNSTLRMPLLHESIDYIWKEIFSCSRLIQSSSKVAFLGPLGTFSHFAAEEVLGHGIEFLPCDDFNTIFASVMDGQANLGLVPLENSQQGSVGQCLDLFHRYDVNIVAEHYSAICQCLLSTETDISCIQTVYSHPQALMQCHVWIKSHMPHAKCIEVSSTAQAAKQALETKGTAALGNENLAQQGTLHLLAKDIAHEKGNSTRFVVISKETHNDNTVYINPKTSLSFTLPDTLGALANILRLFEEAKINLSKLESRPLRTRDAKWHYRFFTDANGDLYQNTLLMRNLRAACHDINILGVYEDSKAN